MAFDQTAEGLSVMMSLLTSKIGINSVSALIEKIGYVYVTPKLEKIRQTVKCNINSESSRTVLHHINKLENEHKNNSKQKFLN